MTNVVNIKQNPDWLDAELWNDYLEYRRESKKPLTKVGEKRALLKLKRFIDEGGDQTLIIERTIECNWLGLFQQFKEEKRPVTQGNGRVTDNDIMRRGKQLGINPKPGESMQEYHRRIMGVERG